MRACTFCRKKGKGRMQIPLELMAPHGAGKGHYIARLCRDPVSSVWQWGRGGLEAPCALFTVGALCQHTY